MYKFSREIFKLLDCFNRNTSFFSFVVFELVKYFLKISDAQNSFNRCTSFGKILKYIKIHPFHTTRNILKIKKIDFKFNL